MKKYNLRLFSSLGLTGTILTCVQLVLVIQNFPPNSAFEKLGIYFSSYSCLMLLLSMFLIFMLKQNGQQDNSNRQLLDDHKITKEPNARVLAKYEFYYKVLVYASIVAVLLFIATLTLDFSSTNMIAIVLLLFMLEATVWLFGGILFVLWLSIGELT